MSDNRKIPSSGLARSLSDRPSTRMRAQSMEERDAGIFPRDEVTGQYEGVELEMQRATRPDAERLGRLEKKHDDLRAELKDVRTEFKNDIKDVRSDVKELSGHVSNLRADVSGAVGKLEGQEPVLSELLSIVKHTARHAADHSYIALTAKAEVDKAQELANVAVIQTAELARVDLMKTAELAKITVAKEKELDNVDARKVHRATIAKLVSGVGVGAYALFELLHRMGAL